MKIQGKLKPLRDVIFISELNFGEETTKAGIVLTSDDGKGRGIKPRWAKVYAIGPEQTDVEVGKWVLMEHGRWTRKFEFENDDSSITEIHVADKNGIMAVADERPDDTIQLGMTYGAGSNVNFNIPG